MTQTQPKYILVEAQLKDAIYSQQLTGKLPGERTLAKDFGCSYMTIRKVVDSLVEQQLLYRVPCKGTYVNEAPLDKPATHSIGYFLDNDIVAGISSPYYSLIFQALEREASQKGYSLIYISDATENLAKTLTKVDGVIASCFPRVEPFLRDIKNVVPVVTIDNTPADRSISSVIIDNFTAIKDSISFLNSLGHKRIGFMAGLEDSDVGTERYAGYCSGIEGHGMNFDRNMVFRGNYSYAAGMEGGAYFLGLEVRPTAILCANDSMALGMISYLSKQGIRVPEQMSVVGFDDIEISSQIVPSLTTIRAPVEQLAAHAFSLLLQQIESGDTSPTHMALATELIARQTTVAIKSNVEAA